MNIYKKHLNFLKIKMFLLQTIFLINNLLIFITVATVPTPIIINKNGINGNAYRSYAT